MNGLTRYLHPRYLHPRQVPRLARYLLRDEAISGKLILLATALALLMANSSLRHLYYTFWQGQLGLGLGDWRLQYSLREWLNRGLMSLFFLVIGLEIKRELVRGELNRWRTAALPIAAATGGMLLPAAMYALINSGGPAGRGWAIPMATDIAFAVGLLSLVGRRVPAGLRLFLLTLAVADDIGTILVITLFYGHGFNYLPLLLAALAASALWLGGRARRVNVGGLAIGGMILWLALNAAGIHPSISGALLGFLAPLAARYPSGRSPAEKLERLTIPWSALVVVPLFAFANTGLTLTWQAVAGSTRAAAGIIAGLVAGKAIGVLGASWLAVKLKLAALPRGVNWHHMTGIGLLAGIGFTVSIFVTELAFGADEMALSNAAKLAILAASAFSASAGLFTLRFQKS